ncbi:MAG: hypothetical protein V5A23_05645 [Halobacteriales archaeon]
MARGIFELAGLAATLALAAPAALLGVEWLVAGRPLGLVFLSLAALMVVVEEHLVGPQDLPGRIVERVVGRVVETPEEQE